VLLLLPFRAGERWSRWALTGVGLFYSLLSLYLTLALQVDTAASIPWQGPAIAVVTLVLAHALAGDTASTQ